MKINLLLLAPVLALATLTSSPVWAAPTEEEEITTGILSESESAVLETVLGAETAEGSDESTSNVSSTLPDPIEVKVALKVVGKGIAPRHGTSRLQLACVGRLIDAETGERGCEALQFLLSEASGRQFLMGPRMESRSRKTMSENLKTQIKDLRLARYFAPNPFGMTSILFFKKGPAKWLYLATGAFFTIMMPPVAMVNFAILYVGFPIGVDILKVGMDVQNHSRNTTTADDDRLGFNKFVTGLQSRSKTAWQLSDERVEFLRVHFFRFQLPRGF